MFTLNELLGHVVSIFALLLLLNLARQFSGSLQIKTLRLQRRSFDKLSPRFCASGRNLRKAQHNLFGVYGSCLREVHLPRQHLVRKLSG